MYTLTQIYVCLISNYIAVLINNKLFMMFIYIILSLSSLLFSMCSGLDMIITDFKIGNFPNADTWPNESDPYLRFHICANVKLSGKYAGECDWNKPFRFIKQTSTKDSDLNPEWTNINVVFSNINTNYRISVELWDEDGGVFGGDDDYVGAYAFRIPWNNLCGADNKKTSSITRDVQGERTFSFTYYFSNCD